jgi:rubrerythrin
MSKIVIDTEAEITKLEKMLENLTDDKDKQSIRFAINLLRGCEKRPTGHWIDKYNSHIAYECSCCGFQYPIDIETDKFCRNCGADMKGGRE